MAPDWKPNIDVVGDLAAPFGHFPEGMATDSFTNFAGRSFWPVLGSELFATGGVLATEAKRLFPAWL